MAEAFNKGKEGKREYAQEAIENMDIDAQGTSGIGEALEAERSGRL